jgi:predicted NodU family carbamoyl transferase
MITLGFNYSQMHDSSACIARDGELLFAVAEERISRIKHDASFPRHAIRACLDFAKVRPDQHDFICRGWPAARTILATERLPAPSPAERRIDDESYRIHAARLG